MNCYKNINDKYTSKIQYWYSPFNNCKFVFVNISVSALSGAKQFLLSLSPATENNLSEDTLVGGADRYLFASCASSDLLRFNPAIMIMEKNRTKN